MKRVALAAACALLGAHSAARIAYGPTPQLAVRRAVYATRPGPVTFPRINVVGRYAVVLARNASIEGSPADAPFLVERFSFGWQPLESLNFRSRLRGHGIDAQTRAKLMRGMPPPAQAEACNGKCPPTVDSGPVADVEALRRGAIGPLVPGVQVLDGYAIVDWYGAGGGMALFEKRDGRWHFAGGGGGALDADILRSLGVPHAVACALAPYIPSHECGSLR